jgi:hypothetical protein
MSARMAPVSMSPTAEAAGERIGFLDMLSVNGFANQFTGPFRARRIARNGANCRHGSPANRSLFRIVVRMAVAALGEPIGGDTIKQRG